MTSISESLLSIPFLLTELFERAVLVSPGKLFVADKSEKLTYAEFVLKGQILSGWLKSRGFASRSRLLMAAENSTWFPLFLYACIKAGGIFVPVSVNLKGDRLDFILDDCNPGIVITDNTAFADQIGQSRKVFLISEMKSIVDTVSVSTGEVYSFPDLIDLDICLLMYTSGSTGFPKAVALNHSNILSSSESIARYLELKPADRIVNFNPFFFDYGLYQIFLTVIRTATLYIFRDFILKSNVLDTIRKERVTVIPFVPSHIIGLYRKDFLHGKTFPSVRTITNTGAPFPVDCLDLLERNFPEARFFSMYGLTECKRVSYLEPQKIKEKQNSVGHSMPNCRIRIVDEAMNELGPGETGQLIIEGRNVMPKYWNNKEETDRILKTEDFNQSSLLLTGDYFHRDTDGDLFFRGRKDDIIKTGSTRVSLKDVEKIATKIPGIHEAAAIAVPDKLAGNVIYLFLSLKENTSLSSKEIMLYIAGNVEFSYMVPQKVFFLRELPKNQNGKTEYAELRSLVQNE